MTSDEMIKRLEDILECLQKIKTELPKKVINQYANHMQTFVTQAIDDFYLSYDPIRYKRTGNLLNFANGANIYTHNHSIKVDFSSEYMNDYKHDSSDYVSTGAFQYGIHGTSEIYVSSPTPIEIFKEKSYQFLTEQFEYEIEKAINKIT